MRVLTSNIYFKHELLLMLKQAGFDEVAVQGDFTGEAATPEHGVLVFIACKSRQTHALTTFTIQEARSFLDG